MNDREVVFVLGSGRSGSSALTRVLSLCGMTLPSSLLAARDMNPRGFWEPADATKLNFEFLIRHGTTVGDPTMCLEAEIDERDKDEFISQVQAFLTVCPPGPTLIIKCAGVVELFEFWLEASRREGLSVKAVIPLRNPQEVLASWAASGEQSRELISAFWIKRNLLAERYSRGLPRLVVEYPNLLKDWRREVGRVSESLCINFNIQESAIDGFLTEDLHRQRRSDPIVETFGYPWMSSIYAILSGAARDEPLDSSALDHIYQTYQTNERAFRIARDEFKRKTIDLEKFRETFDKWPVWRTAGDFE